MARINQTLRSPHRWMNRFRNQPFVPFQIWAILLVEDMEWKSVFCYKKMHFCRPKTPLTSAILNPLSSRFHCPDHLKRRKGQPEPTHWRPNDKDGTLTRDPKATSFGQNVRWTPQSESYVLISFLKMICEQWWIRKLVADVLFQSYY